jgi:hypothetical protein
MTDASHKPDGSYSSFKDFVTSAQMAVMLDDVLSSQKRQSVAERAVDRLIDAKWDAMTGRPAVCRWPISGYIF